MSDTFLDTESYMGSKESNNYAEIIMRHLERITKYASMEMRGGYTETKTIPIGNTLMQQEVYVPDAREIYTNAVNCLHDLLLPTFDTKMKDADKEIEEEYEKLRYKDIYKADSWHVARKLFQQLSLFLSRNGYLQVGDIEVGD